MENEKTLTELYEEILDEIGFTSDRKNRDNFIYWLRAQLLQ